MEVQTTLKIVSTFKEVVGGLYITHEEGCSTIWELHGNKAKFQDYCTLQRRFDHLEEHPHL